MPTRAQLKHRTRLRIRDAQQVIANSHSRDPAVVAMAHKIIAQGEKRLARMESEEAKPPKHSDEVVRRARLLRSRGYEPAEIVEHLTDEGVSVCSRQVKSWVLWESRISAGGVFS